MKSQVLELMFSWLPSCRELNHTNLITFHFTLSFMSSSTTRNILNKISHGLIAMSRDLRLHGPAELMQSCKGVGVRNTVVEAGDLHAGVRRFESHQRRPS